jgi:hypothetical protein
MKQKKITSTMQKVAVDILEDIEIYMMQHHEIPEEIKRIYDRVFNEYGLCRDPFTGMVCTSEEYAKNSLEYDRQTMYEKYGHWDGLE